MFDIVHLLIILLGTLLTLTHFKIDEMYPKYNCFIHSHKNLITLNFHAIGLLRQTATAMETKI